MGSHAQVFKVPAAGGTPIQLTDSEYNMVSDCSPDGKTIALASHSGGAFDLFVMSTDGDQKEKLTTTDFWEFGATWSPDGKQVAYLSNETGNYELYVLRKGADKPVRVTDTPGNESAAAWSPDGKTLLYNLNTGSSDLWTMQVASILNDY